MLKLIEAIHRSWCAATSSDVNWTPSNPALGQCAVTALVLQDYYGGDLVRVPVHKSSHYWNRLDGCDIDLTEGQFAALPDRTHAVLREREYVLSFPDTSKRYELLAGLVAGHLEHLT